MTLMACKLNRQWPIGHKLWYSEQVTSYRTVLYSSDRSNTCEDMFLILMNFPAGSTSQICMNPAADALVTDCSSWCW